MASKKKSIRKVPPGDRMRFLRRKAADGQATDTELRELEKLIDASRAKPTLDQQTMFDDGAESNSIPRDDSPRPAPDDAPADLESAEALTEPAQDNGPSPPPPPPPPHRLKSFAGKMPSPGAAPRLKPTGIVATKSNSASDWRAPYQDALKGAGREASVLFIAGQAMGILKGMSDAIKSVGVKPIVDIEDNAFKAALVLTVDDYLPANIVVKPVHMAAFGGIGLTVQTFYHRKAIRAEEQKVKDRVEFRKRREAQANEEHTQPSVAADEVASPSVDPDVSTPNSNAGDAAGQELPVSNGRPVTLVPAIPTFDPNDIH